jgi:2-amino-4-hydroxy-6-hydroxymethyldihydropteridine diphosphokinase
VRDIIHGVWYPIKMAQQIYLALGSNLGDRLGNLEAALAALAPRVRLQAASPVYETPPWGYEDQPAFLNQVVEVETDLDPWELLAFLKQLEKQLGRRPSVRNGPRLIDLDIVFYNDRIIDLPGIVIPHPHMHERAFVLAPLADLAPNFRHPVLCKKVRQLLAQVDTTGIVRYPDQESL